MRPFDYRAPADLEELLRYLASGCDQAVLMAGGTDLLVRLKKRRIAPPVVIDLKKVPELNGIRMIVAGELFLGALVSIAQLERSPLVCENLPLLARAAHQLGSVQVRHRATVGGNLCNGSPAADLAPALLALAAEAEVAGPGGHRRVPLTDFWLAPGQTIVESGEVLVGLYLKPDPAPAGGCYYKLGIRRAMEIAIVGVAAQLVLGAGGEVIVARLALGAVAPTPLRVTEAEAILQGQVLSSEQVARAAELAAACAQPITDLRASAQYRKAMVRVVTERALFQAAALASVKGGKSDAS